MERKIRVLIAKPGPNGHDRETLMISQALQDHGMEVIYTELRQTPVEIAKTALKKDADVIGLFSLSGAHKTLYPKVIKELEKRNAADIPVIEGSAAESLAQYIQNPIGPELDTTTAPKKIAHIGIAVKCINDVLSFYMDSLGLVLEGIEQVESEQVKVAFLKIGESRIELLEPLYESSPLQQFIKNKGEGIHHIAFEVDQIEARLRQLKSQGLKLINENTKQGANNSKVAFIHPKSANNVLFELCQHTVEKD